MLGRDDDAPRAAAQNVFELVRGQRRAQKIEIRHVASPGLP
jgi:hypothetical protein